jgi:chemotaxis signal transduction protein
MAQMVETSQFLTFTLDEEQYAVDVAKVREVLEYTKVTRVPRMPEYMCGVINLRGSVVPVIDLRLKFGLKAVERTINTSIVVMEIEMGEDTVILGALTDSVKEVIDFEAGTSNRRRGSEPNWKPISSRGWARRTTASSSSWISTRFSAPKN